MKKLITVLLLAVAPGLVLAQANQGYLVDSNNNIVKSGAGLCWQTGYWTPAQAVEGCEGYVSPAPAGAKISLTADTLFDFNKSNLKPEGKATLNSVIKSLQSLKSVEVLAVIGYTDRIGGNQYNLDLSSRRAESVKAYLVEQGVRADTIVTEGRGKANPVTGDSCKGSVNQKLIACLAPDRRVVVEILGTR